MSTIPAAPSVEGVEVAAAPKKRGMMLGIIIGVVVMIGVGAGAWFFVVPKFLGTAHAKTAPVEPPVKHTVGLGAVVVNLNGEARRYVRVGVAFGVTNPEHGKEIEEHKSQVLDLLISILGAADVESLTTEEGKTELKEDILVRLHEELHLEKVRRVYFTEFVIQ